MSAKEVAISVNNVSKSFRLPHEQHSGLKQAILGLFKKGRKRGYETQHVLNNISFDIEKGEFFGIVGRNGSGKSTLLKLISEIYVPDKGNIQVNGRLTPFIELGVGFNPELTGRENVYMNGALLGFSNKQMDRMYKEIVEFAELERFMDQKLKNYSSGMQVRLAFSIAIRADTDILVLDEVLAVGDEAFQRKCFQYFAELKRKKKTVILVTHSMDSVQRFCTKAMLIDQGKIIEMGGTAKVAQKYIELNSPDNDSQTTIKEDGHEKRVSKYVSATVDCTRDKDAGKINFTIKLKQEQAIVDPVVALLLIDETGRQIYRWTTDEKIKRRINLEKDKEIHLSVQDIFPVGVFTVDLRILKRDRTQDYATLFNLAQFEVRNESVHRWDVHWHPNESYYVGNGTPRDGRYE